MFFKVFKRTTHACRKASSLIVNYSSTTKVAAQIFLNETMGKIKDEAYTDILTSCHLWSAGSIDRARFLPLSDHFPVIICNIYVIGNAFECTRVGMMLIISLLRYRAIVHSLKPAISRRKLKVVCGVVYLVGLIVGCAVRLPRCFINSNHVKVAYKKFYYAFMMFFSYFVPTIFMAVVYYKISRSFIKQNKYT